MIFKDLSKKHQGNLIKLQKYMIATYGNERLHINFNMSRYQSGKRQEYFIVRLPFIEHTCGTSACLAGHGPLAGIPWKLSADWSGYIYRSFGIVSCSNYFDFLFSAKWSDDIQEAIARLTMFIEGFDPKVKGDWDYSDTYTK